MQNANPVWLRIVLRLHFAFCILHLFAPSQATAQDLIGQPVVEVIVEQEGQRVTDPVVLALVQTRVGQPLSMTDVRETFDHLFALRRFDDIRPTVEPAAGGARLRYVLVPSHPIDRIEFRGTVSVSETDLRRVVTDRFGRSPNPARAARPCCIHTLTSSVESVAKLRGKAFASNRSRSSFTAFSIGSLSPTYLKSGVMKSPSQARAMSMTFG